jgi:hypothetical protein
MRKIQCKVCHASGHTKKTCILVIYKEIESIDFNRVTVHEFEKRMNQFQDNDALWQRFKSETLFDAYYQNTNPILGDFHNECVYLYNHYSDSYSCDCDFVLK